MRNPGEGTMTKEENTSKDTQQISWMVDLLVMVVCVVGYVFLLGHAFGSIWESEHRVYARVLEEDKVHAGHVFVDFIYGGEDYQKSIDGRGELKPGETVPLDFFRNPMDADWYSDGHRSRGPGATPTGSFLLFAALFGTFIPPVLLWKRFFRGRKPLPLVSVSNAIARLRPAARRWYAWLKRRHARLKQKTTPFMMANIYVLMGVLVICAIGLTPFMVFDVSASKRDLPDLLAEAYLSAMADGRVNDACELIHREHRYDFLSNVRRWELKEYRIIGEVEKVSSGYEYHSGTTHLTMGEGPHIWNVKFWHHSVLDGETIEGTSVLRTIYIGRFSVKSGYIPVPPKDFSLE
jgi:hypothetical protein